MPVVVNPLVCRLFINRGSNGWSERWPLATWNFAAGLLAAQQLALARSFILAQNAVVEWAVVGEVESPWAEQAALTNHLTALPQWDLDNVDGLGLLWRFETGNGQWGNHLFRAIDRNEISQLAWARAPFTLPAGITPLPADPTTATKAQLFSNCFTTFAVLTAFHQRLPSLLNGTPQWAIIPWDQVSFRCVSSRKPGRKWQRVSWEPYDWRESPAFSPCGEVVSVLRSCYAAKCRWYANGSPHRIHYYFTRTGATVFRLPHIFWGRARAKEITNTAGPGEITGTSKRFWAFGDQLGIADGSHFSGAPNDFLGLTPLPWTPESPTPIEDRPACDEPAGLLAMYFGPDYFGRDYFGGDYFG